MAPTTPNLKTIPQFRVEGLNVNGVECYLTGGNMGELQATLRRTFGPEVEFREGEEGQGVFIFRRGETTNPIGWISAYFIPESMSVQNSQRLHKVA